MNCLFKAREDPNNSEIGLIVKIFAHRNNIQKLKDENSDEFTDECKARYGELCRECFLRWILLDEICNPLQC